MKVLLIQFVTSGTGALLARPFCVMRTLACPGKSAIELDRVTGPGWNDCLDLRIRLTVDGLGLLMDFVELVGQLLNCATRSRCGKSPGDVGIAIAFLIAVVAFVNQFMQQLGALGVGTDGVFTVLARICVAASIDDFSIQFKRSSKYIGTFPAELHLDRSKLDRGINRDSMT